jgi:acetyl esterase/lipase
LASQKVFGCFVMADSHSDKVIADRPSLSFCWSPLAVVCDRVAVGERRVLKAMRWRRWTVTVVVTLLALAVVGLVTSVAAWQAAQQLPFEVREDIAYGSLERQTLDLYLPKDDGSKKRPAVIVIHGGAWRSGDKKQLRFLAERFAERGYVAAAINYRLAPKWQYPAQLDDCQRAVRWLRKHADEFGVDPKRFGAAGASAGGHLSLLLGTRETRDDSDPELKGISSKVQCVLDIFGPSDFTDERYVQASRLPLVGKALVEFLGKPYDEAPEVWKEASPITHVSSDDAPTFILHGDKDPLVPIEQSQRIAEALRKAGVEVRLVVIEGMGHGLNGNPTVRQKAMDALNEALAFFDRHLKGQP